MNLLKRAGRRARFAWLRARHSLPTLSLAELGVKQANVAAPILDDVCMPPFVGTQECDDLTAILAVARTQRPATIVELGTAHGNLTANLCAILPDARVVTVNAPTADVGNAFAVGGGEIGRVYRAHGFADRVTQVYANTLELDLSKYVTRASVGLAIVDACHDVDFVINDFHKVQPFMQPGGMVFLHDTHPSLEGHLRDSYTACMLLRKQGFDVRHLANTWWGVWRASA